MKTSIAFLWLATGLTFSLPAFAGGVTSDGGADPLLIVAKPYPDLAGLDRATEQVRAALAQVELPNALGTRILAEISSLRIQGKFLTLPDLIILMPGAGPLGYILPHDATWFVSLGAMTRTEIGAHVFFAERVLKYATPKLANLLLHEVLHHVLPVDAAQNEKFVEDLTESLLRGSITAAERLAIRTGLVVREKTVSSRALAHWIAEGLVDPLNLVGPDRAIWLEYRRSLEHSLVNALPPTLESLTVNQLVNQKLVIATCAVDIPNEPRACEGGAKQRKIWGRVHERFFALAELADPENPLSNGDRYGSLYCKHVVTAEDWYRGNRCATNLLRVTDLFDYQRLK